MRFSAEINSPLQNLAIFPHNAVTLHLRGPPQPLCDSASSTTSSDSTDKVPLAVSHPLPFVRDITTVFTDLHAQ